MTIEDFLLWYKEKEDAEYRIKPEDIYKTIWSCRDFEISHLWQRSVFLAVFLLAVAGAYGKIVMEMYFSSNENSVTWQQHGIATCVCWIGIIFSILWVMMAKGSKYWFEKYEAAIDAFEQSDYGEKIRDFYHHGELPDLKPYKYDENIFSPLSGRYSVSKINASIGIVSMIVFSIFEMFHFREFLLLKFSNLVTFQAALFSISFWLFCGAIVLELLRFLCKAGKEK